MACPAQAAAGVELPTLPRSRRLVAVSSRLAYEGYLHIRREVGDSGRPVRYQLPQLKLVEEKWNLPALTARDAAANTPLDALDLTSAPAFLKPPSLPEPSLPWGTW